MEDTRIILNIQDLPEEILEIIAQFLSSKDLDACFDVCKRWRCILNKNRLWRKCCIYPEKYFEISLAQGREKSESQEVCKWRKCYEFQKQVCDNFRNGRFVRQKSAIYVKDFCYLNDYVDDYGNHWLFDSAEHGITVWNITTTPVFHGVYAKERALNNCGLWPLRDKFLIFQSNNVQVFQFKHPEFVIKLDYRFKFEENEVLPETEVVSNDEYVSSVRYIIVDNKYFIGYHQNVTNLRLVGLHIWDLDSGKKIANYVFQQWLIDSISGWRSDDVDNFNGGLMLFAGDNARFLVNLIDDRLKICYISLFSLVEMRFVKVIAELHSRTAWCFIKGDIIAIYHIVGHNSSQISVYNVNGKFLTKLDFPASYNPAFSYEFWFSGSRVILKVNTCINVLTVINPVKLHKNTFELDEERFILKYFEPQFLLLFDKYSNYTSFSVSIWDIDSGVKLWTSEDLSTTYKYQTILHHSEYPGKWLVHFTGDLEITILNFEKRVQEEH